MLRNLIDGDVATTPAAAAPPAASAATTTASAKSAAAANTGGAAGTQSSAAATSTATGAASVATGDGNHPDDYLPRKKGTWHTVYADCASSFRAASTIPGVCVLVQHVAVLSLTIA